MKPFLIPAIDLKNGQCVRLNQGRMNESKSYSDNPVEMAKFWQDSGANRIHIVDLDGAFAGKPKNIQIIEKICKTISIDIQVGGGIRSNQIAQDYINAGVSQIIIGTKAINEPEWFNRLINNFPNQVILGLDAYGNAIATEGWQETSKYDLFSFAKGFDDKKLYAIIYTDISRDGMLSGINWKQTSLLAQSTKTKIIASGGFSNFTDVENLKKEYAKTQGNLFAAIAGKSLYEKTFDFKEAKQFLELN